MSVHFSWKRCTMGSSRNTSISTSAYAMPAGLSAFSSTNWNADVVMNESRREVGELRA